MRSPDHRKMARIGFWSQLLLLVPFLLIFGATTLNVAISAAFLVIATVRYRWPHNARLRHGEMAATYLIGAAWVVHQIV